MVMLSYHIVDATDAAATNFKWDSTTVQTYTVPANRIWEFYGGTVLNDNDATVTVDLYDAAGNIVLGLASIAAPGAATRVQYPDSDIGYVHRPIKMGSGWYIKITMGAVQGAGAEATCLVDEKHG